MDTLEEIYHCCLSFVPANDIPENIKNDINAIASKCQKQKGVWTVLVTLLYYKHSHPEQDIRYHQSQLPNGFSGRTFDTHNVTPILEKLGLPSMAESGWLTRSLEQPYQVLAFFAIYSILIKEFARYKDCTLSPLSSLTACDRKI